MNRDEKDVSTKQRSPQTHARVSHTHEYSRRARSPQTAPRQRPQTPDRADSTQTGTALNLEVRQQAFPKTARLLVRREFLFLQHRGKRRHSAHFVVLTAPAQGKRPRLGITTTRRFGSAVVRNRMKRVLREFFRARQTYITPAQDILIIPRMGADTLGFAQVAEELGRVLSIDGKAT